MTTSYTYIPLDPSAGIASDARVTETTRLPGGGEVTETIPAGELVVSYGGGTAAAERLAALSGSRVVPVTYQEAREQYGHRRMDAACEAAGIEYACRCYGADGDLFDVLAERLEGLRASVASDGEWIRIAGVERLVEEIGENAELRGPRAERRDAIMRDYVAAAEGRSKGPEREGTAEAQQEANRRFDALAGRLRDVMAASRAAFGGAGEAEQLVAGIAGMDRRNLTIDRVVERDALSAEWQERIGSAGGSAGEQQDRVRQSAGTGISP